jgi:hypothetical protein
VPSFEWVASTTVRGMDGIYGIAGMSTGLTEGGGPLIVPALYEAGAISEPVFGWYLTGL